LEDNLLANPKVFAAYTRIVECYTNLYDHPRHVEVTQPEGLAKKDLQKWKRDEKKRVAQGKFAGACGRESEIDSNIRSSAMQSKHAWLLLLPSNEKALNWRR
jgi:hypothetical protein